jgi:uncharacterized membrane protein YgdD (TMEM256/DUF423 family)
MTALDRVLVFASGICGAVGVMLSAVAAHSGGVNLATAANFLLLYAPALLALGLVGGSATARTGGLVLLVGLTLFAGDLVSRDYFGTRLFPYAAPAGGTILIAGWLVVAASALIARRG